MAVPDGVVIGSAFHIWDRDLHLDRPQWKFSGDQGRCTSGTTAGESDNRTDRLLSPPYQLGFWCNAANTIEGRDLSRTRYQFVYATKS